MPLSQVNFPHKAPTFGFLPSTGQGSITAVGNVFFVDSGSANAANATANGKRPDKPFSTLDYAVGQCTANNGDMIFVAPGHTETISAALGVNIDVAGVRVIGLGAGSDRPTFSYTATASTMGLTAVNVSIENCIFDLTGIDAVVTGFSISAADVRIADNYFLMADSAGQAVNAITTVAASTRLVVENNIFESPNAGANSAILLDGTPDGVTIRGNRITGAFATGSLANTTGNVATNAAIHDNFIRNDTDGAEAIDFDSAVTGYFNDNRLVTDAIGTAGDFGALTCAGNYYSDDTDTDAGAVPFPETATTGGATISLVADSVGGVAEAAATGAVTATDNLMAYLKQLVTQNGIELDTNTLGAILYGTGGIAAYPAAAAAANAVSLAEVLRYVQDFTAMQTLNRNSSNYFSVTADFTSATWNTIAAHEIATVTGAVHLVILPEVTGTVTSGGSPGMILGDETTTNSLITTGDVTGLATGEWWFDATYTRTVGVTSVRTPLDFVVANGKDIGYTITTAALTGGSIVFHCWWAPIDATGSVAAGAGGVL